MSSNTMKAQVHETGFCIAFALGLAGMGGCGKGLCQVEGKVLLPDGTPLKGGMVSFKPLDPENKDKFSCRGFIQEDGSYKMGTYEDADGVPEGKYQVWVEPPRLPNPDNPLPPGWPGFDSRESAQEFTVVRGKNVLNITLKSLPQPEE